MEEIRPFVKWAGGKRMLIPQLSEHFPEGKEFDTYIEPFVGGGAVLIHILQHYKNVKHVYAFDINPNLINCYQAIKSNVSELIKELAEYQKFFRKIKTEEERNEYFKSMKARYNEKKLEEGEIDIEKAALFIFLNRTCFNGLYRENSKGEFNVPFGKIPNKPTICDRKNLRALSKLFKKVEFTHGNYYECEDLVNNKTFVYFDPPYRPITKQGFTSYVKENFNDNNQKELSEFYAKLDRKKAKLMLSNSNPKNMDPDDNFFEELYKEFEIREVFAKRNINSKGDGRGAISELLITNY